MARLIGLLCTVVAAGFLLGSAGAQEAKKVDVAAVFKKLDANSDGKLSKDEFLRLADNFKDKTKARAKLTKAFDEIDPANKGLSIEQFRKYLDNVSAKRKDKSDKVIK